MADNLDVMFGEEWADKIHEIPINEIWNTQENVNFLSFVLNKNEDKNVTEEKPEILLQPKKVLKHDTDFKSLKIDNLEIKEFFKNMYKQTKKVDSNYREKYDKNSKKVTILNLRIICQDKFLFERKNIEKVIDGFNDDYFAKEVNSEKNK